MRIVLAIILLSLTACQVGPPWQQWMFEGPPPGQKYSDMYVSGWKDGCETGVSASSNHWYKQFYHFRQDPILAQNRVYYKGWKDALSYCNRYIYQYDRRALI
jgi:hypothetical protein